MTNTLTTSNPDLSKNTIKPAFLHFPDFEDLLRQRGSEPQLPLKTLPDLNKKLWGLQRKHLYVVGAYTSNGKSNFCLQIARDLVIQNFAVLYLSIEMPIVKCLERLLCQHYRIKNTDLLVGRHGLYESSIKSFEEDLKKWRLVITDCIGSTWQEIDSYITDMTIKPDVIILDFAQLTKRTTKTPKDDYDEYIKHFREMAIRHNFCAILVSQLGRAYKESTDKTPQLHHLQGSSLFEVHADCVILLKWNYKDTNSQNDFNKFTVYISKNRDGATGYCELNFNPPLCLFEDTVPQDKQIVIKQADWQDD